MYFHYARAYLLIAVPITAVGWWTVYQRGAAAFGLTLFLKLFSLAVGLWWLRRRQGRVIFFYRNIGYRERDLLLRTAVADLLVWSFGVVVLLQPMG